MMNQIPIRQNEPEQIQRLAAQRELYSRAKNWYSWQVVVNVLIPSAFALTALSNEVAGNLGAVFSWLAAGIDIFWLEVRVEALREQGAKVQEQFDCENLDLGCSALKSVYSVSTGDIVQLYDEHCRNGQKELRLYDWHSDLIGQLPVSIARLVYQYNNCDWGKRLRIRYRTYLTITLIGILLLITCTYYLNRPTDIIVNDTIITNWFLVAAALTPLFTFYFKQMQEQTNAINDLEKIIQYVEGILYDADQLRNAHNLKEQARQVQDEIYLSRGKNTQVPDFFYELYQKKDQRLMDMTTARLAVKINQLLSIHP